MKSSFKPFLAPALFALATGISPAAVVSNNFEGGLAGWTSTGDVAVQGSTGGKFIMLTTAFTGAADDLVALNLSGNDPVSSAGGLDGFAGLAPGALDLDAINGDGRLCLQADVCRDRRGHADLDWNLATMETVGRDYACVKALGGVLITLGDVADALNPGATPYTSETGFAQFQYVFQTTGNVTVAFGVTDVGDYSTSTALAIDNLSIVPEPSAALLGTLGGIALLRRRR